MDTSQLGEKHKIFAFSYITHDMLEHTLVQYDVSLKHVQTKLSRLLDYAREVQYI